MSPFSLQTTFQELGLPPSQSVIETHSVKNFVTQADFLLHCKAQNNASMIAIMTGGSGAGKTVAIAHYIRQDLSKNHAFLPPCICIRAQAAPKALVEAIYTCLGQKARRSNSPHEILYDAAEAILSNNVKLIVVDHAQLLDSRSCDFLVFIFDVTRCPILIVGTSEVLRTIRGHQDIAGRVGLYQQFQDPDEQEVLDVILPQLRIPFWRYDTSSKKDRALGKQIWECVQPSFRNLCTVITKASGLIGWEEKTHITRATLQNALYSSLYIPKSVSLDTDEEEEEDHPDRGEAEERSEAKKDAKDKKKGNSTQS